MVAANHISYASPIVQNCAKNKRKINNTLTHPCIFHMLLLYILPVIYPLLIKNTLPHTHPNQKIYNRMDSVEQKIPSNTSNLLSNAHANDKWPTRQSVFYVATLLNVTGRRVSIIMRIVRSRSKDMPRLC